MCIVLNSTLTATECADAFYFRPERDVRERKIVSERLPHHIIMFAPSPNMMLDRFVSRFPFIGIKGVFQ